MPRRTIRRAGDAVTLMDVPIDRDGVRSTDSSMLATRSSALACDDANPAAWWAHGDRAAVLRNKSRKHLACSTLGIGISGHGGLHTPPVSDVPTTVTANGSGGALPLAHGVTAQAELGLALTEFG
jgi:hypothetical protein